MRTDTSKPLPALSAHAPLSVVNRTGHGIATMTICSCGWKPARASERGSTACNAHMAHRRSQKLPRADYSQAVFGEGPWTGWTWNDWYAVHGSENVSPYTGIKRIL